MQQAIVQSDDKMPKRGGQRGEAPAYQQHFIHKCTCRQLTAAIVVNSLYTVVNSTHINWIQSACSCSTDFATSLLAFTQHQ